MRTTRIAAFISMLLALPSWTAAAPSLEVGTPSSQTRSASGRVQRLDATPIAAARIRWLAPPGNPGVAADSARDGTWTLRDLPAEGTVLLEATAPGFHAARAPFTGAPVTLVLLKASAIRGRLASMTAGVNLEEPAVHLETTGAERGSRSAVPARVVAEAKVAKDGTFTFEGIDVAQVALVASGRGFVTRKLPFGLGAEAVDAGTIELEPGAGLTGRLLAAEDHAPLAGAKLRVVVTSSPSSHWWSAAAEAATTADADGRFSLKGLAAGKKRLVVEHPTRPPAFAIEAELARAEARDLGDVEIAKAARLRGRVVSASGEPRPGIRVVLGRKKDHIPAASLEPLAPESGVPAEHSTRSGEDGTFLLGRLPPGEWAAEAVAGGILADVPVTLVAGAEKEVELKLEGIPVHGHIFLGETPLAGADVVLLEGHQPAGWRDYGFDQDGQPSTAVAPSSDPPSGHAYYARTDAAGAFEVAAVVPTDYELRVHSPTIDALRDVTIAETEDGASIDVDLAQWLIRGRVQGRRPAADKPIPVSVVGISSGRNLQTEVGSDGSFLVGVPGPGVYGVGTWLPGVKPSMARTEVPATGEPADVTLSLPDASPTAVDVRLRLADGGVPTSWACWYQGAGGSGRKEGSSDAVIHLSPSLQGPIRVMVAGPGFGPNVTTVQRVDGETVTADLVLDRPGSLDIRDRSGDGNGMGAIQILDDGGFDWMPGLTTVGAADITPDGVHVRLPPGQYAIVGKGRRTVRADVRAGMPAAVTLASK